MSGSSVEHPPAEGTPADAPEPRNFIQQLIDRHIEDGRWGDAGDRSVVRTRFPPEPNGYLHVGHAKSICLNFGLAAEFGGSCNLRFDDTNPAKEEQEYVDSIITDVRWLGFRWDGAIEDALPGEPGFYEGVLFASDYFEQMHDWAVELIKKRLAYVDEQTPEEIRAQRGNLKTPGTPSPHRDRPTEESLDLFERMSAGEFADGAKVLRAKIDMASPNITLRDPVMYRVVNAPHHRTGDRWHIYPMYDWAHGLEDSIEGDHQLDSACWNSRTTARSTTGSSTRSTPIAGPGRRGASRSTTRRQTEFSRLNPISYTNMSKR